jgi:hypothetical protein
VKRRNSERTLGVSLSGRCGSTSGAAEDFVTRGSW